MNKKICKVVELSLLFCCVGFGAPLFNESVRQLEIHMGALKLGVEVVTKYLYLYSSLKLRGLKGSFKFMKSSCGGEECYFFLR